MQEGIPGVLRFFFIISRYAPIPQVLLSLFGSFQGVRVRAKKEEDWVCPPHKKAIGLSFSIK